MGQMRHTSFDYMLLKKNLRLHLLKCDYFTTYFLVYDRTLPVFGC